jgi:hypothetical protein
MHFEAFNKSFMYKDVFEKQINQNIYTKLYQGDEYKSKEFTKVCQKENIKKEFTHNKKVTLLRKITKHQLK